MSQKLYASTLGNPTEGKKLKGSFLRRFSRRLLRLGYLHCFFLAGSMCNAYFNVDSSYALKRQQAIQQYTEPQAVASSSFWRGLWRQDGGRRGSAGRFPKHLSTQELECVQAITSLFSFDLHPRVFQKLMPMVMLSDPWFTLRGSLELRDAWYFLSCLCESAEPVVTNVSRWSQDPNVLFMDMETTYTLRYLGTRVTMPSSVKITIEELGKSRRRVSDIEHHWFGNGPITGTISYSDNFMARGADMLRHVDGFLMSVFMSTEHLVEHWSKERSE